jgi:hypothetical protein
LWIPITSLTARAVVSRAATLLNGIFRTLVTGAIMIAGSTHIATVRARVGA